MTILALYSNKGGVGKTAAAVNLAYLAAQSGLVTLICDLDPQASTTFYFRVKPKLKPKARGLVKGRKQIDRSIKGTDYENLDLLPANFTHRNLDITFNRHRRRKQRLRIILEPLRKEYDLIILDSPPTINILAENIFNAADHLLVPLIPSTLSIRTHAQLLSFLKENKYRSEGVYSFFSFVDGRKKMHRELAIWARGNFSGVLRSVIPYLSHVEQMGIYRQPVPAFAPASPASRAYQDLGRKFTRSYQMKECELNLAINALSENQNDWNVDTITKQIWSEMNGAVTRSTIQEMLSEVIPNYEKARIQTFVPIFIRRDAIKRLRSMRAPIVSPVLIEADVSTESQSNSDPSSSRNAHDNQDKTIDTDLIHWKPAT